MENVYIKNVFQAVSMTFWKNEHRSATISGNPDFRNIPFFYIQKLTVFWRKWLCRLQFTPDQVEVKGKVDPWDVKNPVSVEKNFFAHIRSAWKLPEVTGNKLIPGGAGVAPGKVCSQKLLSMPKLTTMPNYSSVGHLRAAGRSNFRCTIFDTGRKFQMPFLTKLSGGFSKFQRIWTGNWLNLLNWIKNKTFQLVHPLIALKMNYFICTRLSGCRGRGCRCGWKCGWSDEKTWITQHLCQLSCC